MSITDADLHALDSKLQQLKLDYEHYFLGSRPTEPQALRSECQKLVQQISGQRIQNTALRFRFNGLNARFQTHKRQWDNILRQIDAGTYERHVFKARLHERERGIVDDAPGRAGGPSGGARTDLFASYRDAAMACGQDVSKLTADKLDRVIAKQRAAVQEKLGCSDVDFRVVVQDGKVKLKASARR